MWPDPRSFTECHSLYGSDHVCDDFLLSLSSLSFSFVRASSAERKIKRKSEEKNSFGYVSDRVSDVMALCRQAGTPAATPHSPKFQRVPLIRRDSEFEVQRSGWKPVRDLFRPLDGKAPR